MLIIATQGDQNLIIEVRQQQSITKTNTVYEREYNLNNAKHVGAESTAKHTATNYDKMLIPTNH